MGRKRGPTARQQRRRLTLIKMTPDLLYDQLIGMGCAEKLIFSWGGNPGVGSLHRLRDAVENSWPHQLAIEEHSHAAMANAYEAGAAGLPCAIFRGYIGVDLPKVNPRINHITCPFTGAHGARTRHCMRIALWIWHDVCCCRPREGGDPYSVTEQ